MSKEEEKKQKENGEEGTRGLYKHLAGSGHSNSMFTIFSERTQFHGPGGKENQWPRSRKLDGEDAR